MITKRNLNKPVTVIFNNMCDIYVATFTITEIRLLDEFDEPREQYQLTGRVNFDGHDDELVDMIVDECMFNCGKEDITRLVNTCTSIMPSFIKNFTGVYTFQPDVIFAYDNTISKKDITENKIYIKRCVSEKFKTYL